MWTWSHCAQTEASISESLRRGLNESHPQSPGTGATPHSDVCPVQESPDLRKCWFTLENFRTPSGGNTPSTLSPCLHAAKQQAKKKSSFEREQKAKWSHCFNDPSVTPWLATTRQIERAGTSQEAQQKRRTTLSTRIGLDRFELVPQPNSASCARRIKFPRCVVSHFSA